MPGATGRRPGRRPGALRRAARFAGLVAAAIVALALACTPYSSRLAKLRGELSMGNPEQALKALDELKGDGDGLPYLMDRGLLLYLSGDYAGCQEAFAQAQAVVEELYTKSLSREFLRLAVNDLTQPYQGEIYERVWIHYFRALGYLAQDNIADAAVEGRAVTFDLQRFADAGSDDAKYRNDPFLQYFAGLLLEANGELNEAWISYGQALRLYAAEDVYGVGAPDALVEDLFRSARRLGFLDELASYQEQFPDADPIEPAEGEGEVVVLVSSGLVPSKLSERLDFPIFRSGDDDDGNDEAAWHAAQYSYDSWHAGSDLKIEYILSIALPAVAPAEPPVETFWEVGGRTGELDVAADLGALARQCLADRYASVVVRTAARALVKYWAKEKVEEKKGEVAGFLVNILGSAVEVADTRSWSTLPAHVYLSRVVLPAGRQTVTVRSALGVASGEVDVRPGRLAFLSLQLY